MERGGSMWCTFENAGSGTTDAKFHNTTESTKEFYVKDTRRLVPRTVIDLKIDHVKSSSSYPSV